MDNHTFPAEDADRLEDAAMRYRHCSAEELLWALDPTEADSVVDLGSGTGFYTDDVAPHVETVYAVDLQAAMQDRYREKGVPENVELVTSGADDLPFAADSMDAAFATTTYHELPVAAFDELARVVRPGGRVVVVDWTGSGDGEYGPPVDERHDAAHAAATVEAVGLDVEFSATRAETFLLTARLPDE